MISDQWPVELKINKHVYNIIIILTHKIHDAVSNYLNVGEFYDETILHADDSGMFEDTHQADEKHVGRMVSGRYED